MVAQRIQRLIRGAEIMITDRKPCFSLKRNISFPHFATSSLTIHSQRREFIVRSGHEKMNSKSLPTSPPTRAVTIQSSLELSIPPAAILSQESVVSLSPSPPSSCLKGERDDFEHPEQPKFSKATTAKVQISPGWRAWRFVILAFVLEFLVSFSFPLFSVDKLFNYRLELDLGTISRVWDFSAVLHLSRNLSVYLRFAITSFDSWNDVARSELRPAAALDDVLPRSS